jgi:Cu(I)/Ag(I) efflux system membrane protein CusA/SilA
MSLTGIAIAIGVLVDAGIVMTENVIRQCERALEEKRARSATAGGADPGPAPAAVALTPKEIFDLTLSACQQIGRPMFLSIIVVVLAFVPVFMLGGQAGKLFHPLAWTKVFAILGALLLAVTVVPVLCTLFVRGPFKPEEENWLMKFLLRLYDPLLNFALRRQRTVLALAAALLVFCVVLAFGLPRALTSRLPAPVADLVTGFGTEFMPTLEEGSLLFMPVLLPATSLTEVKRIMAWQDRVISEHPAVASVAGKLGRADTATDPAPVEMIETTIMLKPEREWPAGTSKASIIADLSAKLMNVPGYVPGFLQPIENRVLMTSTGIRAQLGIKLFGDDLDALQRKAFEIERVVNRVPGATGVAPSRVQGKPYLEIAVRREDLGRYGLSVKQVYDYVEAGLGGATVGTTLKGRERWPLQVRLEPADREDIDRLGELPLTTPSGALIQLRQVADIRRVVGPNEIASENGRLRVFVQANVAGRDLGGFVQEVKRRVTAEVKLEPGMAIEYAGEYEQQLRTNRTMMFIFPLVLAVCFAVLILTFRSVAEAAHVLLAVPFALTGGVLLQWAMGFNFSTAVWVGYIALFGTAIQTGVVMVVYLEEAVARARERLGRELDHGELLAAVKEGARLRLRPKVMTIATTVASLLPILWSSQTGAEVMKPLAAPVVGGSISSLLHILVVTPVIFAWLRERKLTSPAT